MRRITLILVSCLLLVAVSLSPTLTLAQQTGTPTPDEVARLDELHLRRRAGELLPAASYAEIPNRIDAPDDVPADLLNWNRAVAMTWNYPTWELVKFDQSNPFTNPLRLTNNTFSEINPRLNHAATRLVFASRPTNKWQIEAMNINGAARVTLAGGGSNSSDAAWSPDDARIVFASDRDGNPELYVMQADGSNVVRLTNHPSDDYSPTWSSDGQWIAWFRVPVGASVGAIWAMRSDGSGAHMIADGLRYLQDLVWSPDSTSLAFDYDADWDGWTEIATIRADGTQLHTVYDMALDGEPWVSDWSMDGYLYYTQAYFSPYCSSSGCWYQLNASNVSRITPEGNGNEWFLNDGWHYYLFYDVEPLEQRMPFSNMAPLPSASSAHFTVSWSGGGIGGSTGFKNFDVQVKDGNGSWIDWLVGTTLTTSQYSGVGGHTYYFRVRARDNAYNVEFWPATYDAVTTIESSPPETILDPLPPFARLGFKLIWHGTEPGDSGIQNYELQYRDVASGSWTDWLITSNNEAVFTSGSIGHTYEFRLRGRDWANNVEAWSTPINARVTIHAWGISGLTADHAGRPVIGVETTLTPLLLGTLDNTTRSIYGASALQSDVYTVTWQRSGYGALGTTSFNYDPVRDVQLDLYLPPPDNVVANSHFEVPGALASWQAGGSLPPTATSAVRYTGLQAAQLGSNALPPFTTFESIFVGSLPRLAVDDDQTVHLVTVADLGAGYNSLRYAARPLTGTWPITPTPIITANGVVSTLALAPDQLGGIHLAAVWGNSTRSNVFYCHSSLMIDTCATPTQLTNYTDSKVTDVRVQLDQSGGVHLVFSTAAGVFYRSLPDGGSWSSIETIAPANPDRILELGIDRNGTRHVLWSRNEGIWDHRAYYTQKIGSGAWQTPTEILNYAFFAPVADVGPDGSVYVVWTPGGEILATEKLAGHGWTTTTVIPYQMGYGIGAPLAVRVNDVGTVRAVINRNNSIYQVVKEVDTAWHAEPEPVFFSPIVVDIDARGIVHSIRSDVAPGALSYQHTPYRAAPLTSVLSQTITVPADLQRPALSFMYRADWGQTFSQLSAVLDNGITVTEIFSTSHLASRWQHAAIDVQAWAGQVVTFSVVLAQPIGAPHLAAQLDAVVLGSSWTPSISGISVTRADAWTTTPVTITGDNFAATPLVKIGATSLTNVQWIDEQTLTATLPGLPPGPQDTIWVINPGGQASVLNKTIMIGRLMFLPLIKLNHN